MPTSANENPECLIAILQIFGIQPRPPITTQKKQVRDKFVYRAFATAKLSLPPKPVQRNYNINEIQDLFRNRLKDKKTM